jgi:MATE family multidrug resistance protein
MAYLAIPGAMVSVFEGESDPARFAAVAELVPALLAMAAAYSVADGANMTFAFALRGAGDTRFVSVLTFLLAWPVMVVPTFLLVRSGGGIEWAWAFATAYILAMVACFSLRFRSGKWKRMRVIEAAVAPAESSLDVESCRTRRGDLAGEIAT